MSVTKPRDVQILPIATDTTIIRSRSWTRLRFEIEYALSKGTTANSYIIKADKIALIDPPGETFTEKYLDALQQSFDVNKIDYLIIGHDNQKRAATLRALFEFLLLILDIQIIFVLTILKRKFSTPINYLAHISVATKFLMKVGKFLLKIDVIIMTA